MGKGAVLSGLLHLAAVLLAVFGLPWLYDTDEVLQATPVSVISEAQFAELQSTKPPAQQKKQEQPKDQEIPPAPKAPDVAQPESEPEEPAPPEPAPPEPVARPEPPPEPQQAEQQQPVMRPEPPPEQPQQQVVAPEPQPEPEPQPVTPPEPQVAEAQPKPVPPKKPDPPKKKEESKKKKEKDKPKQEQVAADDTSFLKDIEKKLKKNQKKSQPQQQAALPQDSYSGPPMSEGEKDMIRQQVQGNWIIDIGMQGLEDMTVEVRVRMNPDGSVQSATVDQSSSNGHPNWPIYADSCRRAVLKSSPLRMPPDKPYAAWATMTLVFNAREMLGY